MTVDPGGGLPMQQMMSLRLRRLIALIGKETLQVRRDPSCILIAFVLPVILLFIFGYGLSLDAKRVRLAMVLEDRSPTAQSLWSSFEATQYIAPILYESRRGAEDAVVNTHVRGMLVVPKDFTMRLAAGKTSVQLITDGVETNTAAILENYVTGVVQRWAKHQADERGITVLPPIDIASRVYFNPELQSRNALIPGSVVLIMAIIGTLLTSLVVSREWERGTMEAMLATPISPFDMILGKLIPYYVLGMSSTGCCVLLSYFLFHVPLRGSFLALFLTSSAFLTASLGMGFFISTICRNQFFASQLALLVAFLPSFILSGALFEISAMPSAIRTITHLFPARYYVTCLQTVFMAGDIWPLLLPNTAVMLFIAVLFFGATIVKTPKRLE